MIIENDFAAGQWMHLPDLFDRLYKILFSHISDYPSDYSDFRSDAPKKYSLCVGETVCASRNTDTIGFLFILDQIVTSIHPNTHLVLAGIYGLTYSTTA